MVDSAPPSRPPHRWFAHCEPGYPARSRSLTCTALLHLDARRQVVGRLARPRATTASPSSTRDASASASSSAAGAGAARSRAITSPRRCRKLPANAAWRGRASPGSGPRVAHRRRTGHSSHRGARGRHRVAPTSMSARSRSRPRNGRPTCTDAASAARSLSRSPVTRSTTRLDVHLDRGEVSVVSLREHRGRGVAARPREAHGGRRASRASAITTAASYRRRARRG